VPSLGASVEDSSTPTSSSIGRASDEHARAGNASYVKTKLLPRSWSSLRAPRPSNRQAQRSDEPARPCGAMNISWPSNAPECQERELPPAGLCVASKSAFVPAMQDVLDVRRHLRHGESRRSLAKETRAAVRTRPDPRALKRHDWCASNSDPASPDGTLINRFGRRKSRHINFARRNASPL
jgi:hypothetical protein